MKIRRKGTEPRDTVLTIRLSNAEKTELKRRASSAGLSVGAFLVDLALDNKSNRGTKTNSTARSTKNTTSSKSTKTSKNTKNTTSSKSTTSTNKSKHR